MKHGCNENVDDTLLATVVIINYYYLYNISDLGSFYDLLLHQVCIHESMVQKQQIDVISTTEVAKTTIVICYCCVVYQNCFLVAFWYRQIERGKNGAIRKTDKIELKMQKDTHVHHEKSSTTPQSDKGINQYLRILSSLNRVSS